MNTLIQGVNIHLSAGNDVVFILPNQYPSAFGGNLDGTPNVVNACSIPIGSIADVGHGDYTYTSKKHEYTFTFTEGETISSFQIALLDWGDFFPFSTNAEQEHSATLTAFDADGDVVDAYTIVFSSHGDGSFNRFSDEFGNLVDSGDACTAEEGVEPGRVIFKVEGSGITRVEFRFRDRESMDPHVALWLGALNLEFEGVITPEPGDHYLSYDVKEMKGTPKFEKRDVTLTDQFETGTFEVKKLKALYNPVDKNNEGIIDPNTHLVGYEIKRDKDEPKHEKAIGILVENQFGEIIVDIEKPDRLLVPSAKSLTGPVGALPLTVDHFKCYKVKVTEGTPAFVPLQVTLEDQFTAQRVFEVDKPSRLCNPVDKPSRLCNPVDKNNEGIIDPENHLMCYEVRRADLANIHVNNQFGLLQVETKTEKKELCVPSTKTLP